MECRDAARVVIELVERQPDVDQRLGPIYDGPHILEVVTRTMYA
jgi:hypothetical protein